MQRLAIFLLFLIGIFVAGCGIESEVYARSQSPDGRFEIVVYRNPMLITLPGQGSDASGYIELYDAAGNVLQSTNVDMVQNFGGVEWEDAHVSIPLIAEWELPE
jgi:hypothetical protein